ncbi:hypothetical protein D3C71_741680 [compost metagenome]
MPSGMYWKAGVAMPSMMRAVMVLRSMAIEIALRTRRSCSGFLPSALLTNGLGLRPTSGWKNTRRVDGVATKPNLGLSFRRGRSRAAGFSIMSKSPDKRPVRRGPAEGTGTNFTSFQCGLVPQ